MALRRLAEEYALAGALGAEVETTGGAVSNFDIVDVGALEEGGKCSGFLVICGEQLALEQVLPTHVGVKHGRIGGEIGRVASVLGIALARCFMDKDRSGKRNRL